MPSPRRRTPPDLHRLVPGSIGRADLALFRAVARGRVPGLDPVLPRLSRLADHSKLWMGIGVLLVALGGRRGRRAALRGLLSVALASGTVNLPLKLAVRRARPPIRVVPRARRLARVPVSGSLPSGHSASAAAFATGVALELPGAGVPIGAVATAVGFSRIYTGVHYPADVAVGAAIGGGIALTTTLWWPRAHEPRARPVMLHAARVPALPHGEGLVCCANPDAGAAWSPGRDAGAHLEALRGPEALIADTLPRALVRTCSGTELASVLDDAGQDAKALGVLGGDGSVNTAAEAAHRRGLPLLVMPAGTHNHLARDIGLTKPSDALEAVGRGAVCAVDVAEIAGRPFLNAASFGGYAAMVGVRERYEDRIGKWPAVLWALLRVLREGEPVRVEVDGRPRRVWMLFAGNCRYQPEGFVPASRERLDDGLLDVRLVDADVPWARTRLALSVLTGRLGRCKAYEEWLTRAVGIRSSDGALPLVRDGELFDGPEEFEIRKSAEPLMVFTPLAEDFGGRRDPRDARHWSGE